AIPLHVDHQRPASPTNRTHLVFSPYTAPPTSLRGLPPNAFAVAALGFSQPLHAARAQSFPHSDGRTRPLRGLESSALAWRLVFVPLLKRGHRVTRLAVLPAMPGPVSSGRLERPVGNPMPVVR